VFAADQVLQAADGLMVTDITIGVFLLVYLQCST
jgi:hypothetical protein